jgi:hypothetical protein
MLHLRMTWKAWRFARRTKASRADTLELVGLVWVALARLNSPLALAHAGQVRGKAKRIIGSK